MLARLSVWSEVQTCIWPSWCKCHSLSLASLKSRLVLPFWHWLTWVVANKGPLNVCVCVCVCGRDHVTALDQSETCVLELPIRHYYCVYLEAWMLLPQSWNPVRQCLCAVIPVYAWHLRVVSYKPRVYYKPAPNGWTTTIKNQQSIYVHYPENTA